MYSGLLSNNVKTAAKPAATVAKTAAPAGGNLTLQDLVKQGVVGIDTYERLFSQLGLGNNAWNDTSGGYSENTGDLLYLNKPNDAAMRAANGYAFNFDHNGVGNNNGALRVFKPDGTLMDTYQQQDRSGADTFKNWLTTAAIGFGGAGLAGLGPLAGALGGAGAAGAGEAAAAGTGEMLGGLDAVASFEAGTGGLAAGGGGAAAGGFNAALDSQLASNALGITGAQSAAAATVPATVNLGSLGGTMATSGGLGGALNTLGQGIRDATASSNVGGSLLSQAGGSLGNAVSGAGTALNGGTTGGTTGGLAGTAGDVAGWLKANPALGKLLMSGAMGLLSSGGGGGSSSSSGGSTSFGPAKNWTSSIQQGLLTPVQQVAPPALQRPAGLLAQGQANDGAWRYLLGGK